MNQALTEAMTSINRSFGPGTIRTGDKWSSPDRLFTGISTLDRATCGIPFGRIVEIFGSEGSGKSTLAENIARCFGDVLYMDTERGLADAAELTIMYPETLEGALQAVEIAVPAFDAIVIDSLTALPTRAEAELDIGDFYSKSYAAAVLAHALPRLVPALLKNRCTLIVVNQMRNIPGIMYGKPDKPTGGRALRHYASLRLETARIEVIQHGGVAVGQSMRVTVQKNKYGAPFGRADIWMPYGRATA